MFVPRANISDLWAGVAIAAAALMFAAILAPVIWAAVRGEYRRHKARKGSVVEWGLMALMGVGVVLYGGAKGGGRVDYPRTNANYELLRDAGSSVSNDFVTIAYTRHQLVPDGADLQVWRRPLELTNDTDWVEHLVTTVGEFPSPQTIEFANAISNNWAVFTTWSPAPAVQTNGVLHVLWRGTNSAPHRLDAIPLGSEVRSGYGFVFAPPRKAESHEGCSVLEVTIPEGGGDFGFYQVQAPAGTKISWGDGSETEYTQRTHHYPLGGKYVVVIGKEATYFQIVSAWNTSTDVFRCLALGDNLHRLNWTFGLCKGMYGAPPAYSANITTAAYAYYGCTGLSGAIPAWNDKITSAASTYYGCTGLSGAIPAWNDKITSAASTYNGCTGLTSLWASDLTDEEIMPSRITSKGSCVGGTSAELRAHFYTTWGGTKPLPTE